MSCQDDWSSVFQVVVSSAYRVDILHLAHDHCLAGHMGIKKTIVKHIMRVRLLMSPTRKFHLHLYILL